MTYAEKLRDPQWQRKRLEIFERDKWQCVNCGSKKKMLHVHHMRYESGKEPWEYPDYLLVTLCEDCHKRETDSRKLIDGFLNAVLQQQRWTVDQVYWLHWMLGTKIKKPSRKAVLALFERIEKEGAGQ